MRRRVAVIAALSLAALLGFAVQAQAATFTVGTNADTASGACPNPAAGNCSLRQLILFENNRPANSAADTILVPANANPYQLNGTELLIQQNVNIVGAGARTTTIEQTAAAGVPRARVFDIQPNANANFTPTVTISGLTIEFGFVTTASTNGAVGGNILNAGTLTLAEDEIVLGEANGGTGGGVSNDGGTLLVTHSLIDNNLAVAPSGTGGPGAGIENRGTSTAASHLTIDNSTIVSNDAINAGAIGGAVVSRCTSGTSTCSAVTITNSTIADNDGGPGSPNTGGLLSTQGSISVENSIIAGNTLNTGASNSNCRASSPGTITSLGHNLEDHADCGFSSSGDLQNTNPQFLFSGTTDTGGNTETFALSASSPAVDSIPAGAPGCSGTDQRDIARPQGSACDIGAYELTQQVEGLQFTQVVGSVDRDTDATIDWGDGTPRSSTHSDAGNGQVTGTHTYVEAGVYHGEIHFVNSDGLPAQTPFDIKVVDAPLSSAGSAVNPIAGVSFAGPVATFTDANPFGKVSDFSATVTWGDGTATPGVVSAGPSGGFVVTGPHTYAAAGTYPTTIAITDVDGASTTAHGTAIVGARPSQVVTGPPDVKGSATAGFAGSVNPDGAATTAHFEYGLDRRYVTPGGSGPQYDHSTPSQPVGSDFASHSVSASVSGAVM